jgi:hypothetical protein
MVILYRTISKRSTEQIKDSKERPHRHKRSIERSLKVISNLYSFDNCNWVFITKVFIIYYSSGSLAMFI